MSDLVCYKTLPQWNAKNIPSAFKKKHNTKVGTWAQLSIMQGELKYYTLDTNGNILDTTILNQHSDIPVIKPQAWHKIEPISEDLQCQLSFYCLAKDYYAKKYNLSATHSEMFEIIKHIHTGKALDFGCGKGRNALFLQQQGFDVDAFDKNPDSIRQLKSIIDNEQLANIHPYVADAENYEFIDTYDLIVASVILMFLNRESLDKVIMQMQSATKRGGFNLIICVMDTPDYPLSAHELPFTFGLKSSELNQYYKGWEIKKYNENIGHLHRLDNNGNPIALNFATLIAEKP